MFDRMCRTECVELAKGQGAAKNKKIYTYEKMKVDEETRKQTKTSLIYDYSSLCHHVPDENVKS